MKEKIWLFASALWFLSAGSWAITLFVDFYYKVTPGGLVFLHGVTVLASLIAAVTNYARYKKQKDSISEEGTHGREGGKAR